MIELEENARALQTIKSKLESIGESLWHSFKKRRIKKIRRANTARKLLATRHIIK